MKKIRVLIADDSVIYRSQIKEALENMSRVEVVATASNGRFALERLTQTSADLLVLDLEMPEMDGIQTLTELKKKGFSCKVLVFSSTSQHGAKITLEALRLGASDFIPKPGPNSSLSESDSSLSPSQRIKSVLEPKIYALFPETSAKEVILSKPSTAVSYQKVSIERMKPKIIVIGSSTGGPTVLEKIFSGLTSPIGCPIVITQHMPPVFTAALANRLKEVSGIPACEATHGMKLENNHIYIAPGDYHMRLQGSQEAVTLVLDQGPLINWVRPAVDPLFASAAEIFKGSCLSFVLTGMGSDGKVGAEVIKQHGGAVIIQSEKSCVVFGMPGAVYSSGAYDRICEPSEITTLINEKTGKNPFNTTKLASNGGGF